MITITITIIIVNIIIFTIVNINNILVFMRVGVLVAIILHVTTIITEETFIAFAASITITVAVTATAILALTLVTRLIVVIDDLHVAAVLVHDYTIANGATTIIIPQISADITA